MSYELTPRQREINRKLEDTGFKSLTASEKRTLTYGRLRQMGYTAKEADVLRKNFNIINPAKRVDKLRVFTKQAKDKLVRRYYQYQLGYSKEDAVKNQGRRLMVWKDTLAFLRRNEIRLENEPRNMPKIPSVLHGDGVKLLANTFHYLNKDRDLEELLHEFGEMDSSKILFHQYRLERFYTLRDDDIIRDFMDTLDAQSSVDDYYKMMDATYKDAGRPGPDFKGETMPRDKVPAKGKFRSI